MITRFVILRRRQGLNKVDFSSYWEHHHGKLMSKVPGLMKYIQYHVESEIFDNTDFPIDGIEELHFDSEQTLLKALQSPQYKHVVNNENLLFDMRSLCIHPLKTLRTVEFNL